MGEGREEGAAGAVELLLKDAAATVGRGLELHRHLQEGRAAEGGVGRGGGEGDVGRGRGEGESGREGGGEEEPSLSGFAASHSRRCGSSRSIGVREAGRQAGRDEPQTLGSCAQSRVARSRYHESSC